MRFIGLVGLLCLASLPAMAQNPPSAPMPRDYREVRTFVDGVFITPVPNAPFTANVRIVSHTKLPDGTEHVAQTTNHIARSSSGRIRNERRQMVPSTFLGEPRLLSAHLYDPSTRVSIFFDPMTHLARQQTLRAPEATPAQALPQSEQVAPSEVTVTDLGSQQMGGMELQGTRKVRTLGGQRSGTGQPVTITDEYWYSPALSLYMVIKHDDPRTGEQLVAVTDVERAEPPAELMTVPTSYKLVDETPPELPASAQ